MPTYYTPAVNTWHATIAQIDDSDAPDASDFNLSVEDLADNIAYINGSYVDGKRGGTYNPTAPIIIGDNGLEQPQDAGWWLYGLLHFDGTITGSGAPTPTLNFDGTNALLWLTSGAKMQVTASSVTYSAGAGWIMQTGTSAAIQSGAELDISAGAHVFVAGPGGIHIETAGGTMEVDSGGKVNFARGDGLTIADGTNPSYPTPRNITVPQPIVMGLGTTFLASSGPDFDKIVDLGAGGVGYLLLTELIHGATMTSIVMRLSWASPHTPTTLARVTLLKSNILTGANATTVAFTAAGTIDTSGGSSAVRTFNLATPEVIDRSTYRYTLKLEGEDTNAQAITWRAPVVSLSVPQLGEF